MAFLPIEISSCETANDIKNRKGFKNRYLLYYRNGLDKCERSDTNLLSKRNGLLQNMLLKRNAFFDNNDSDVLELYLKHPSKYK